MRSPTFSPSPTTTSVVPSGPVAAVQLPLPSLAVQVISPAMAKVETRHSAARSPPSVLPEVWSIGCPFVLQRVRGASGTNLGRSQVAWNPPDHLTWRGRDAKTSEANWAETPGRVVSLDSVYAIRTARMLAVAFRGPGHDPP